MTDFTGKTVVITGACGNLGQAVVAAFAEQGANLVLADRVAERLDEAAQALNKAHKSIEVLTHVADLSTLETVDAMFEATTERFGQVDAVVHTVGGFAMGDKVAEGDVGTLYRMLDLNVKPLFLVAGRAAHHMQKHEVQGHIVVVLARSALKGSAGQSAYTASKAAAQRVMESLALEVRDQGIHVNGVLPSTIDTLPNRESMPKADFSKWVLPADLAGAILFLCSPAANALYGVSLEVYNRA